MAQRKDSSDVSMKRMYPHDVRFISPALQTLRSLVLECKQMYPQIDRWLDNKVLPGVEAGKRAAFVAYVAGTAAATAIVKVQANAKLCHLRIVDDFQDLNLGALFFSIMALESRLSESIHFTLPESLWERREGFFKSFGFSKAVPAGTQYRLFDRELCCAARIDDVWGAALTHINVLANKWTISGQELLPDLVMSLKPEHAGAILSKRKRVEVRRRFSNEWIGARVALYSTAPLQAVVGDARIANVVTGEPDYLWKNFGHSMGCDESAFLAYARTSPALFAIMLEDVRPYRSPLMRGQLERLSRRDLKPPLSYASTASDSGWALALGVAAMLHATASTVPSVAIDPNEKLPARTKGR